MYRRDGDGSLTPHKIAVLILIEKYGSLRKLYWGIETDNGSRGFANQGPHLPPNERKAMCVLISKLIQANDMTFSDLLDLICNSGIADAQISLFFKGLKEVYDHGIEGFLLLFDSIEKFSVQDEARKEWYPCLWTGLVGLHMRQLTIIFRRLSFSHLTGLYEKFCAYYEKGIEIAEIESPRVSLLCNESVLEASSDFDHSVSMNCSDMNVVDTSEPKTELVITPMKAKSFLENKGKRKQLKNTRTIDQSLQNTAILTKSQAETFIQDQIFLLLHQDPKALKPKELQDKINLLLETWPDLGKGHFATYLNCLRAGELPGAIHSLIRAYDSKIMTQEMRTETGTKSFRYGALNMASLQAMFGNKSQALLHLEESIRLSQEYTDHTCLQHTLAWLYTLTDSQKVLLMRRSHERSSELGLPYLSWLGSLNYTMQKVKGKVQPETVLKKLLALPNNPSPCSPLEGGVEGAAAEWCSLAALWSLWGHVPLAAMSSHMVLNGGFKSETSVTGTLLPDMQSPTCAAICNIALMLNDMGDVVQSRTVLKHCQELFPMRPHNSNWMFASTLLSFKQAIYMGQWSNADNLATAMATTRPTYSKLLKCLVLVSRGEMSQCIQQAIELKKSNLQLDPHIHVRILLVMAEALAGGSNWGGACDVLTSAIEVAQSYHMMYMTALARLQLAVIQLHLGLVRLAKESMHMGLNTVLSGGGLYDQARARLLKAKVEVCSLKEDERKKMIPAIAKDLDKVQDQFGQVKAYNRQKEAVYIKARLYHECGLYMERNHAALEFRQLEQQHPMQTVQLNTCVF